MAYINVQLDPLETALITAAAAKEGRSKRAQFKRMALAHARSILPDFRHEVTTKSRRTSTKKETAK